MLLREDYKGKLYVKQRFSVSVLKKEKKGMKWCVIGAGGIADRRTIPALLKDKENELVAVMDRVPAAAENIGKKYGVAYFTDEKQMLTEICLYVVLSLQSIPLTESDLLYVFPTAYLSR